VILGPGRRLGSSHSFGLGPILDAPPLPWPVPAHALLSAVPARAASAVHRDRTARSAVKSDLVVKGAAWGHGRTKRCCRTRDIRYVTCSTGCQRCPGHASSHRTAAAPLMSFGVSLEPVAERDWVRGSVSPGWTRSVAVCYITSGMKARPFEKSWSDMGTDHQCRRTWL
jgi:hypothetical protein